LELAAALYADSAAFGPFRGPAAERPAPPASSDVFNNRKLAYDGTFGLGWSLFGYRYETVLGGTCKDGEQRSSAEAYVFNGVGNCYVVRWMSGDPFDCRIVVHVGEAAFQTGTCYWAAYQYGQGF
jgi:hypothetical protein